MTPLERAIKIVSEEVSKGPKLYDEKFKNQTDFIRDVHKKKALFCTRRAAKSYTGGLYLADTALRFARSNCLYLGLTRLSAKGIIWKDVLKQIDRKNNLGFEFNGTELTATAPNGSMIYVTGVDADEDEMHKLLGKKWKLVILDEAQAYGIDLRALVYGVLGPAMIDEGGTICMMGTAGNLTQGLFYDVSTGKEPGWKLFEWSAFDNPYVAKQWQKELDEIDQQRPLFKETSLYKQWYLNQWVVDEDAKVYRFSEARNTTQHLPYDLSDFHYLLGVDLAHSPDSTAFVVGCYHDASPILWITYSYKQTEMDITDVALKIHELERKYKFEVKVVDGANKQAVAELNNRHQVGLIAADKTGKADFINIMNAEFIQGKIQLIESTTKDLQDEYQRLIWVTDANGNVKEPKKENPNIHQDLADSALYLWRYAYQYLFKSPIPKPVPGSLESWEPKHIERLQQEVKQKQNPHELDLHWDQTWDEDEAI